MATFFDFVGHGNLDVRFRVLLHVVCEYDFCVQGRIDTSGEQKLDGLVKVVHARDRCAVGFCLRCIGAGNGIGGRFALEIFRELISS